VSGREPEEIVRLPALQQRWRDMLFLHWGYPPEVVRSLLPRGLRPDTRDGRAWVSLTPFRVEAPRPGLLPALPGLPSYPETNLRTYVIGPGGVDGLWFLTLEVGSALNAVGGRLSGVPYRWAEMSVVRDGAQLVYTSRRRGGGAAGHRIRAEPGGPLNAGDLDHHLTGRWRAWVCVAGRLATVPVQHEPWPLERVEVVELEESLRAVHGLPAATEAPLAHFSPGVDARLGGPRLAARGGAGCTQGSRPC
jgi:uncharacterized protein